MHRRRIGQLHQNSLNAETIRLMMILLKIIKNDSDLSQYYHICLDDLRSHIFQIKCLSSSFLCQMYNVTHFSVCFCYDSMGNRDGELEENTCVTNFFRPHNVEILACTKDGDFGCDYPGLRNVTRFWRKDGTDSHVPGIVNFLRQLQDKSTVDKRN